MGRPASSALRVHQHAETHPILSIASTAGKTAMSFPTVSAAVDHLHRLGILREITGKQRRRLFVNGEYVEILSEGADPLR
jgi:Fic family protein